MKKYALIEHFDLTGYSDILRSTRNLLNKIGVENIILKNSSLGTVNSNLVNEKIVTFAVINNIIEAKKNGVTLLAIDDNQYSILRYGFEIYKNDTKLREKIIEITQYSGEILEDDFSSIVDILSEDENLNKIKTFKKHPFFNFSAYFHISNKIYFDSNRRKKIESIFKAIDLDIKYDEISDYSSGAELVGIDNDIALKLASKILESSIDSGADFTTSFDLGDMEMQEHYKDYVQKELSRDKVNQPFISPQQLILISLGERDKRELGLDKYKNRVDFIN